MSPALDTAGVARRRLFERDFTLWYAGRSISAAGTAASAVALPLLVSIAGLAVFVVAVLGLAATSAFTIALLGWAVWSLARLIVNANGITVRQLITPDELQGRVNTTGRMIAWVARRSGLCWAV